MDRLQRLKPKRSIVIAHQSDSPLKIESLLSIK